MYYLESDSNAILASCQFLQNIVFVFNCFETMVNMEILMSNQGYFHIIETIFDYLDNDSICHCKLVNSKWYLFITNNVCYHRRKLKRITEFHLDKSWFEIHQEWGYLIDSVYKGYIEWIILLILSKRTTFL